MTHDEILMHLNEINDEDYADFQSRLLPGIGRDRIIGVRTPVLRAFAKELSKDPGRNNFLKELPHETFDENQLHAFVISLNKDFEACLAETEAFLPYVDNWATCDQLSPKIFKKNLPELFMRIKKWIASDRVYTVRFAIGLLMQYYLEDQFDPVYPLMVSKVKSDEYYINMMIAWYFATALAKRYEDILPYLTERRLDAWTHNKTIQKAVESFRITPKQKEYLKTLKVKSKNGAGVKSDT